MSACVCSRVCFRVLHCSQSIIKSSSQTFPHWLQQPWPEDERSMSQQRSLSFSNRSNNNKYFFLQFEIMNTISRRPCIPFLNTFCGFKLIRKNKTRCIFSWLLMEKYYPDSEQDLYDPLYFRSLSQASRRCKSAFSYITPKVQSDRKLRCRGFVELTEWVQLILHFHSVRLRKILNNITRFPRPITTHRAQ